MSKHIYIDCQSFQTEAWDRGMGRYTMSLLEAMYQNGSDDEYTLLFSKNLPENKPAVKALEQTLPNASVVFLDLLQTNENGYKRPAEQNKVTIGNYIQHKAHDKEVFFLIPSLFQEPTASVFPDDVHKAVIYYDAIPFLYYGRYKDAINYRAYMERYKSLYEADTIFTISQTIADDLLIYFGIGDSEHRRVVTIDGACNEDMFVKFVEPEVAPEGEYILLPSSSDIRKNNHSAVKAFEQLRSLSNKDYKLVITSTFSKAQQAQLRDISPNIQFTGNISESELAWLYAHATVILFTSEYEGLGLPILESVRVNKPVACSNLAVFREISEDAFYFFDPLDVQEITLRLHEAIEGKAWAKKQKYYKSIDTKYRWSRSAEIVLQTVAQAAVSSKTPSTKKPRVAILGPVTGGYSAIGKVIQELHDVTSQVFEIDYYLENNKRKEKVDVRPNLLKYLANCYPVSDFNAKVYAEYDAVVYHIGNSEYHFNTILNALHLPGITIFHDTSLKEAFGEMVRLGFIDTDRYNAESTLGDLLKSKNSAFLGSITNNSLGGIVHSDYAQKAIGSNVVEVAIDIVKAELPTVVPARNVYLQKRSKVHVGLAGVLTGNKGIDTIKQIAQDDSVSDDIVLHVFGFNVVEPEIIAELSAYKNVKLMTDLSDQEYQAQLSNLDILVNFREEYRGETSLTVLEAMRYGCVVIVNGNLGWFSELPNATVAKITDKNEVIPTISKLISNPKERSAIAEKARSYVHNTHAPKEYVELLSRECSKNVDNRVTRKKKLIRENYSLNTILRKLSETGEVNE